MSNENVKEFGAAKVDATKGGKARVQFIEAGKSSGVFVQPIYVANIREAGVQLDDVLSAIAFAWNQEAQPKPTKAQAVAPKLRPVNGNDNVSTDARTAAAMAVELYDQGNEKAARQLASDAGIISDGRSARKQGGLRNAWAALANAQVDVPVQENNPLAQFSDDELAVLRKLKSVLG